MKRIVTKALWIVMLFLLQKAQSATQVQLGETLNTTVDRGGARVFNFLGREGQVISVAAIGNQVVHQTPGVVIQLLSPNDTVHLGTDRSRLLNAARLDQIVLPEDGEYTLIFSDDGHSFLRDATAWLTIVDVQSPDDFLTPNTERTNALQISDMDVYGFEGKEGETVIVHIETGEGTIQPYLSIVAPDGKSIHELAGNDGVLESNAIQLSMNGSYSLLVRDASGAEKGSYKLTLDIQVPGDSDGDGLADDWELRFFENLEADAERDPDKDMIDNRTEFVRGTNPLVFDPSIGQEDSTISIQVESVSVEFLSLKGKRYQLEGTADLRNWVAVGGVFTGNNQIIKQSVPVGEGNLRYFRVVQP